GVARRATSAWRRPGFEHPPFAADALELAGAAVNEVQAGADRQLAGGGRDERGAGLGGGHEAGSQMNRDPAEVVARDLHLAGMDTRPDLDVEPLRGGRDGQPAPDRP